MATHKSAIKRQKQSEKKRADNQIRKTRIKNLTKEVLKAVDTGDGKKAAEALAEVVPAIMKAASRRTIHPNAAARKVSRLTRRVNTLASAK